MSYFPVGAPLGNPVVKLVILHVLVPGNWTVSEGHDWAERIESDIRRTLGQADVTTHLEPLLNASNQASDSTRYSAERACAGSPSP